MAEQVAASCTGACCEGFTLCLDGAPMSWDAVQARQADPEWQKQAEERNELERFAVPGAEPEHFNCRMFDQATRQCTIYSQRPDTCRSFPFQAVIKGEVTNTCHHCGLTLSAPTPP